MTSLATLEDVRALVNTSMSDPALQAIINRIESQINERIGAPQDDTHSVTVTRTLRGENQSLFLPSEIYAVVGIVEDDVTVDTDEFRVWAGGVIERLPLNWNWGQVCVVTYKPADDRAKRKQVIIDLVRLVIERTAMKAESVGGEYSYTAFDDWDVIFNRTMRRLTFRAV